MKKISFLVLAISIFISCKKEPVANFEVSGTTTAGGTLLFENHSSHSSSYVWDFGDQSSSTFATPTHVYKKPGNYVVMLTVKGDGGSDFTDKTLNISGTTYSFSNSTSYDLPQFCTYYWDGTYIQDFIEHGILSKGKETDAVVTHRPEIEAGFIVNDVVFIIPGPFSLTTGQHNNLAITNETPIYSGKGIADSRLVELIREKMRKKP